MKFSLLLVLHVHWRLASGCSWASLVGVDWWSLLHLECCWFPWWKEGNMVTHVPHLVGFGLENNIISTHILLASKWKASQVKWPRLTSSGQKSVILSCFWREETQKYLVNSTKCLTLHKPDTVIDAADTKTKGVCPCPRESKFLGSSFI